MDVGILKALSQVAGLAGISIGIVFLIFRETIRKSIFPKLSQRDAYRVVALVLVLSWSIGLLGIGGWVWTRTAGPGSSQTPTISTQGSSSPVVQGVGGNVDVKIGK